MKANELMIGDWVMTPYGPHKIDILYGDYGKVQADLIELDYSEIQPIPLTTEIMEKNGWSLWEIEGEYKGLISIYGRKAPFLILDCVEINYIHELQHALRLVGVDKEIVI